MQKARASKSQAGQTERFFLCGYNSDRKPLLRQCDTLPLSISQQSEDILAIFALRAFDVGWHKSSQELDARRKHGDGV
jgi:hypothetical protein